jgi:serine protease Do
MAKKIMGDLISKGYVVRAWLGVYIQELDDAKARALDLEIRDGALITDVIEGSPAKKAGIQEGDLIISFDGEKVKNTSNLKNLVSLTAPGSRSKVEIIRNGRNKTITVILEEMDQDESITFGKRESSKLTDLGLEVRKLTNQFRHEYEISEADDGLIIVNVDPTSDAAKKGIRSGDLIKRVGTKKVDSVRNFKTVIEQSKEKGAVLLLIKKPNGNSRFFTLKL